jgi:Chaperone of endosialidase
MAYPYDEDDDEEQGQSVPSKGGPNTSEAGNWAASPNTSGVAQGVQDTNTAVANTAHGPSQAVTDAGTWVGNAVEDAADWVGGAVETIGGWADDMFSAEQVSGPEKGEWGTPGTRADRYNADQRAQGDALQQSHAAQGAAIQQSHAAQGAAIQDYHGRQGARALEQYQGAAGAAQGTAQSGAAAATDRAGVIAARSAPTANYGRANATQSQTDRTLAALDTFASRQDGPSGAQAQLRQATNTGLATQLAMARSGRGFGGGAASMGQAQANMAGISANAANESAQLRAQEFATARQRELAALDTAMGGRLNLGQQQIGQSQFDTSSQLQQTGMNDAASNAQNQLALQYQQYGLNAGLGYGQLGEQTALQHQQLGENSNLSHQQLGENSNLSHQQLGEQSNLSHQQLGQHAYDQQAEYELEQQQMELDARKANQSADLEKDGGIIGTIGGAIGGIASMFSDEREKKNIKKQAGVASELERQNAALDRALGHKSLNTVKNAEPYSYHYKDPNQPGAKAGRMVGPMAQDLEKGPLGDSVVDDTPQGKMVNTGRLTMVNSSAIAEQQKQIDALNRALKRKRAA